MTATHAELPLAVIGMCYREGPTSARTALLTADQGAESPSVALLESGAAAGILRIETCSRVTWVLSSPKPGWAAELLRAGLLARAGDAVQGREPRVRIGRSALDHVFRVALGLDAVVEGERAVGRQVMRAFDRAHTAGQTDPVLHLVWRVLGDMLTRRGGGGPRQRGVAALVAARLQEAGVGAPVPILGTGEIGRNALRAVSGSQAFARKDTAAFLDAAARAAAVVVCTGGPAPWVELPARADLPLAVDIGSPTQISAAPGWRVIGLDTLLTGLVALSEAEYARLSGMVDAGCDEVAHALAAPPPSAALAALDAERRAFLAEELPSLASGLSPEATAALEQGVRRLGHRLIRGAAGAGRGTS